ncbi:MAG TPA: formimidoylglutamate deiminase [Pyrinomonadaceae bacterium]|jgi:formimidoylglutamate deiminase|nr:formimidoylglutamate deiminase [Pyrinomonadaceae bacterium]
MVNVWLPDLIYTDRRFESDVALVCDENVIRLAPAAEVEDAIRLKNRALLPGLVNAHSHAFQRVIRGRTERRSQHTSDSFWTWREQMYGAANRLSPEDIYVASRMAFLEMALAGITAVGEFHYLHHAPDGSRYDDPNLLEREVIRAARDVGLRIALLRVAYARAGHQTEPNPQQIRFIESSPDEYLSHVEKLLAAPELNNTRNAWVGVAPHSVRAVPLDYLKRVVEFANARGVVVHMHVAEQTAEVAACIEEYRRSPVALLDTEGLLSERFTAVHAIHVTPKAIAALARHRANVCACPTTERNLGDGVVPVDGYFNAGVAVSLGTDSQTQIDLLEDARELEYHLRLQHTARNVLAPDNDTHESALARRLFACATTNGATSIGFDGGNLEPGAPADFFTVDLDDPSIAGSSSENLLANIVFSLSRTAIKDVVVAGKRIVVDGRHTQQDGIVRAFQRII